MNMNHKEMCKFTNVFMFEFINCCCNQHGTCFKITRGGLGPLFKDWGGLGPLAPLLPTPLRL